MESLAGPARLEIGIDEWRAAQEEPEAVSVQVTWRAVGDDPTLAALFAGLPSTRVSVPGFSVSISLRELVPIKLLDGRTEFAPEAWKGFRFGKGLPIYELARADFEAWSGENSFLEAARKSEIGRMVRRLVPDFDGYTPKEQLDFLIRTQKKIDAVRQSAEDLANHLEYAKPGTAKAVPPLKNPILKVRAAVFSDMLKSTRRAAEILEVPSTETDNIKNENGRVKARAKLGRALLHDYYGKSAYEAMIERMQRYHRWWKWFDSIEDPKEQMYVFLAEAQGTSAEHEQLRAAEDGFAGTLEEWIGVVERRLEASEVSAKSENPAEAEKAQRSADQLWHRQKAIEQTDTRFRKALSLASLEVPPPSIA